MTDHTPLDAALEALAAGLCPIRARADGSKAPLGQWKHRQFERPGIDEVMTTFADSPNVGLVTGEISDRLVCLEFEGRFMARMDEVRAALEAADLWVTFKGWRDGYSESTPSGGVHILIHLGGEGRLDGNRKIALDERGQVTIETRGEAGFVIIAPSNGTTHPTGGTWTRQRGDLFSIAWVDQADFDDVCAVLALFDESPAPPPRGSNQGSPRAGGWVDDAIAGGPRLGDVLVDHGWRDVGRMGDRTLWRRPGKTRGISATSHFVTDREWLYNHSTSTAPVPDSPSQGGQSFDVVDIVGCYELGRLPSFDERVGIAKRWAPAPPPPRGAAAGGKQESLPTEYLPDEFWSAEDWLGRIHEVALQRMISPEALLGAFLSTWAAMIPPGIVVPGIVIERASLNTYATLVGPSGGGKTGAMALSRELIGFNQAAHPDIRLGAGLRSGEGLVTLAVRPQPKRRGDDDDSGPSYRQGVQLVFDEGTGMSAQNDRIGSTILPWLCTIWAGSPAMVGGSKASGDEGFPANQVRFSMLTSIQPGAASSLFTGDSQRLGFPQRLAYFATDNPVLRTIPITADIYPRVEPLDLPRYRREDFRTERPVELGYPPEIWQEVREWHQLRTLGDGGGSGYDSHQMNLRLRMAGLLALARSETIVVTSRDWELAKLIEVHSRSVRGSLVGSYGAVARERALQQGRLDAFRDEGRSDQWVIGKAERIARWVHSQANDSGHVRKDIKGRLSPAERPRLGEIMAYAETYGWVIHRDGRYFAGPSQPA